MPKDFRPVDVDRLVLASEKPSRYVGGEVNSIVKDLRAAEATWVLAFPDTYEVGMSNLGFRVLYHVLNRRPEAAAERCFMPWGDMAAALRRTGTPLFTLESRAPVRSFDVLGFTLQFELAATSVLAMLDLAGIPLLAEDRTLEDPLVIGGGPCAHAPEPMAPFFDAFVVGEGEEVVHEITDLVRAFKGSGGTRRELLWELAELRGVYVPSLFEFEFERGGPIRAIVPKKPGYARVRRRVVPDLNAAPFPDHPVLPFMHTVHDRLPIEIQRGCTRGCRFCQVGMLTRPTRQRDPHEVRRLAEVGLASTGYEEVSFLSLSAGDYQCLNGMLEDFFDRWAPERVSVGIPSLRTETMNARLAEQIRRVKKGGFTVAPEAATERMRRVINKGNEEKDLLHAVETIFGAGWDLVKFYFMIGLPTERDEDVREIVHLAKKALAIGRRYSQRAAINVGVSTFVPKPFTPFQWEPHIPIEETRRKHQLLREAAPRGGPIDLKYHDAEGSRVEAALCLGDRRASTALLHAYRNGAALDGWSEHFSYDRWLAAFAAMEAEHGVSVDFFAHREKGRDELFSWDVIDAEVSRPHLWKEREKARREAKLVDCAIAPCTVCGACDYEVARTRVYDPRDYVHEDGRPYDLRLAELTRPAETRAGEAPPAGVKLPVIGPGISGFRPWEEDGGEAPEEAAAPDDGDEEEEAAPPPRAPAAPRYHVRLRYAKTGRAVAVSHLETMTVMARALRRAQVQVAFSEGFNPKPRLSFGPALPVGAESRAEYFDAEVLEAPDVEAIAARLAATLPAGFTLLDARQIPRETPSLQASIAAVRWRATLPASLAARLAEGVAAFHAAAELPIVRERAAPKPRKRRGKRGERRGPIVRTYDLKRLVDELAVEDGAVVFTVRNDPAGSARPGEVLEAVLAGAAEHDVRLVKEEVRFS